MCFHEVETKKTINSNAFMNASQNCYKRVELRRKLSRSMRWSIP